MTSCDILRMAEALRCKVVIPIHYDVWTNFMADVNEISGKDIIISTNRETDEVAMYTLQV